MGWRWSDHSAAAAPVGATRKLRNQPQRPSVRLKPGFGVVLCPKPWLCSLSSFPMPEAKVGRPQPSHRRVAAQAGAAATASTGRHRWPRWTRWRDTGTAGGQWGLRALQLPAQRPLRSAGNGRAAVPSATWAEFVPFQVRQQQLRLCFVVPMANPAVPSWGFCVGTRGDHAIKKQCQDSSGPTVL